MGVAAATIAYDVAKGLLKVFSKCHIQPGYFTT